MFEQEGVLITVRLYMFVNLCLRKHHNVQAFPVFSVQCIARPFRARGLESLKNVLREKCIAIMVG